MIDGVKDYIAQSKRTYGRIAMAYHKESERYVGFYSEVLAPFEKLLKKEFENPSILDIGCGSGLELEILAKHGFSSLNGMDISPQMLKIARENISMGKFYEGNILTKRLNRKFDVIMMFSFMHLFMEEDVPKILKNVNSMLSPQGYYFLTVFNRKKPRMGFINKSGYGLKDVVRYVREYTPAEMRRMLIGNGFKITRSYTVKYTNAKRKKDRAVVWVGFIAKSAGK